MGASCELNYIHGYPATVNSISETDISAKAAIDLVGKGQSCAESYPEYGFRGFFRICCRLVLDAMCGWE
ncbi:MAG: hypothetical protein Ct9H300mP28_11520 [Pseudomonadota bacterium]|nr:MAG: hypothetical protein Ct9H300mP28_11520 [Pseudomonadota bacterium]